MTPIRSTAGVLVAFAGLAQADIAVTTTDPGIFRNADNFVEGRIRLDGGNSQTWKLATWEPHNRYRPQVTNGNGARNLFGNGVSNAFTMTYSAATGELTLSTAGQSITDTVLLPQGTGLSGFKYFITSDRGDGMTMLSDMMVSVDGQDAVAVAGLESNLSGSFALAPLVYFDQAVSDLTITGNLTFGWSHNAKSRDRHGDRSRLSVHLYSGESLRAIPTPGAAAAFGLAALGMTRRRRR